MSGPADRSWDWVVVGAGSAGAVVAEHLSRSGDAAVLLLEAGTDFRPAQAPPEMRRGHWSTILDLERFPQFQWTRLVASRTPERPPTPYWRGRGAGGSSSINGMVALRPPLDDFDAWGATDPGLWSRDAVLAQFVAMEDDRTFPDLPYHGRGGPIPVSRAPLDEWGALDLALKEALEDTGHPWEPDANRPGAHGASPFPYNADGEERVGTNEAYLEPARARRSLTVVGDCLVDRVLVRDGRAEGVRALTDAGPRDIRAGGVVLSAGAVHSPAILMRSGIGPAGELAALGIGVVADLAVGRRLQEHPAVYFGFGVDADLALPRNGRHTNLCVRWTSGTAGTSPDDMMGMGNGPSPAQPTSGGVGLYLNQACARGRLSLASDDPTVDPEIQFNLGGDERDRRRLAEFVVVGRELLAHRAMAALVRGPVVGADGSELPEAGDAVAVDHWLRATVDVSAHASATAPIGHPDDGGVVDSRGRVYGLDGLWVIDMSIAPSAPRANTNLTAIMAAGLLAKTLPQ